ncbi:hypothetical protein ASF60_18135 [Methylobacterium sp. Leaf113]|uniref:hypothetical protein n=1 Tax=Methylobacterium sp. Leaf113 TaxID=1736259 RepID=UPI0007002F5D|nr:hypothetical protein [Methylobacterium sp. Leaf113]KQP91363.1 hypothetical protein ASF60_18135 [Methylobacterium sp. Leaf113]
MPSTTTPTEITATHVLVYGAEHPAEIVDRRLDGRLLVANPGKANAWLVLDGAAPPKALMKALKGLATENDIRIVVRKKERPEAVAEAVAIVESFMTDGSAEKAAKREAGAKKAAATRAAERAAIEQAEREAAAQARAVAHAEERRRIDEATRSAREAAAAERAAARYAEEARLFRVRSQRTIYVKDEAPCIGETFFVAVGEDGFRGHHVVAESHGKAWVDHEGDTVCYVYWRHATGEERAAYVPAPRRPVVTLRAERAPQVGQAFRLRDGTEVVAVDVRRRRYLDDSSEDVTSFYSSELWGQHVVDVEYEART